MKATKRSSSLWSKRQTCITSTAWCWRCAAWPVCARCRGRRNFERGGGLTMRALEIPESLLKRGEELARQDRVSLDIWVTSALAKKIGVVETAEEFFKRRS